MLMLGGAGRGGAEIEPISGFYRSAMQSMQTWQAALALNSCLHDFEILFADLSGPSLPATSPTYQQVAC